METVHLANALIMAGIAGLLTWSLVPVARIGLTLGALLLGWMLLQVLRRFLERDLWEQEAKKL